MHIYEVRDDVKVNCRQKHDSLVFNYVSHLLGGYI